MNDSTLQIIETDLAIDYFDLADYNKKNLKLAKQLHNIYPSTTKILKLTNNTDMDKLLEDWRNHRLDNYTLIIPEQLTHVKQNLHILIIRLIQLRRHYNISLSFLVSKTEYINPFIAKRCHVFTKWSPI